MILAGDVGGTNVRLALIEVAVRTLEHFASIYGGEAGNLALKVFATGGVFVGGGIAPKILPKLLDGTFFGAFCDKGASPRSLREFRSRWS